MFANLLSISRIFLTLPLIHSLRQGDDSIYATVFILLAAAATDLADGFVARRVGNISRLGKMLDPLSDKVFLAALLSGLVLWDNFPAKILVMLMLRDICIVIAGTYMLKSRGLVIAANSWGKGTTTCLGFTAIGHVLNIPHIFSDILTYVSILLIIISSISYTRTLLHTIRGIGETEIY